MNTTIDDLIKLTKENPDLPIYCRVNNDIMCPDEYAWTLASMTYCSIEDMWAFNDRLYTDKEELIEDIYFAFDDILDEKFNYSGWKTSYAVEQGKCSEEEYKKNQEAEKKIDTYIESIIEPYKTTCIMISIDAPVDYIENMYDNIYENLENLKG